MEKVVSKRDFLTEMLQEYNFERVEFVYEPGQYSIRGSIVDVFSFSGDLPYRIDFFSEEVDSIRSFNTDDQLSVSAQNQIQIIPNIQDISIEEINDSFTDFLPPSSILWMEDPYFIKEKMNSIYFQTLQREDSGQISGRKEIVIT
ncbi:MAG: transcription-repair coupling factor, partial [Acidobacteriales bacterium]